MALISPAKLDSLTPSQLDAVMGILSGCRAWTGETDLPLPVPLLVLLVTAEAESSLDPRRVGDGGTGIGLYQWGMRPRALGAEAVALGAPVELLLDPHGSTHAILRLAARDGQWAQLCIAGTPADALRWWTANVERPDRLPEEHQRRFRLLLRWVELPQYVLRTGLDLAASLG